MTNATGRRSARTRIAALLLAMVLNLTIIGSALAAEIVNGDFSTTIRYYEICTFSGWQTTGSVGVDTEADYGLSSSSNCVAKVDSSTSGSTTSTLSQVFTVPAGNTLAHLNIVIDTSSSGFGHFLPQTITIYNSAGAVIYSKSRSSNGERFYVCQNLDAYEGQDVELVVKTSVAGATGPRTATLYVDNIGFGSGCIWPNATWGW